MRPVTISCCFILGFLRAGKSLWLRIAVCAFLSLCWPGWHSAWRQSFLDSPGHCPLEARPGPLGLGSTYRVPCSHGLDPSCICVSLVLWQQELSPPFLSCPSSALITTVTSLHSSGRPSAPNICTHSASVVAAYSARRFVEQAVSSVYPEPPDGQQEEQPAPCLYSYFWVIQSRLEFTSPPAKRLEVTDLVSSVSDT